MTEAPEALRAVSTDDLIKMLRALYKKQLTCPVTTLGLACARLQHVASPIMSLMRDLPQPAVQAILVAVIAERTGQPLPKLAPEPPPADETH